MYFSPNEIQVLIWRTIDHETSGVSSLMASRNHAPFPKYACATFRLIQLSWGHVFLLIICRILVTCSLPHPHLSLLLSLSILIRHFTVVTCHFNTSFTEMSLDIVFLTHTHKGAVSRVHRLITGVKCTCN